MADIWTNVGTDFTPQGEDWLYQKGGQIHGPVPKQVIVDKLLKGDMDVKTKVAREGGEFHPIGQVKAFAPHLEDVKRVMRKRAAGKVRLVIFLVLCGLGAVGAGGYYYFKQQAAQKTKEAERLAQIDAEKQAAERQKRRDLIQGQVELVGVVTLDESAMQMGPRKSSGPKTGRPDTKHGGDEGPGVEDGQIMSQCKRGQAEIFGVLKANLAKINFCVEDEKKRDAANLPNTLTLSFVATPEGKVTEFEVLDRHLRTGPMRNCMQKVFNIIRFNPTGGSNCPVSIPIKIGG